MSTFSSKMAAENSLFELEAVEVPPVNKNACRKRKPNFSVQETAMITQTFEEKQAVLESKFTNTTTNKFKQSVWEEVTIAVNAVGTAHWSVVEVKEKCTNLQRTAKNELSKFHKEQRKTGGGPPPKTPSPSTVKILELLKDTVFERFEGFETAKERGLCLHLRRETRTCSWSFGAWFLSVGLSRSGASVSVINWIESRKNL